MSSCTVLTIKACSEGASHFSLNYQTRNMSLANYVDQSASPSLADFNAAAATDALKWTDLEQNVDYQITNTRAVNTQHGQLVNLSPQKADGTNLSAWACGMLSTELLQNPMVMVCSRLFVLANGQKVSESGRVYNSYQLLQL